MKNKKLLALLVLVVIVVIVGLVVFFVTREGKPFEGKKVVVVTQVGPSIAGPVEMYAPEWEKETGGEVELVQLPWDELFQKTVTALSTGSGEYDVLIFPAPWSGDYMAPGYLEPIPQKILDKVDMEDVIPLYRERIITWGNTVYALPYDGDSHMLYYRKDLINNPDYAAEFQEKYGYPLAEPKTWKQYYDIAEFFNGKEVETAGQTAPVYGVMEAQKPKSQGFYVFFSHAAGYAKIPGNPCFFFSCEDMTPQINNPGWVKALEDFIRSAKLGPPEQINWDVADTRDYFPTGMSVFNIDWGDVGPISIDESVSKIKGQVGFAPLPGGDQYWDYEKGEWVTPEGGVNMAPFIAFGGWIIGVAADSDVKEAALDFAAFMARPELVKKLAVTGGTGINPARFSQFEAVDLWVGAGFDEESARDYLDAILTGINHPNAVLDLRITGTAEYQQALDVELNRALTGEISAQEALDNAARAWDEITDRLGRENQLAQYRASVGSWTE
ncbi:MAG: sugar ABC transporter substrate-binding protein [Anaerolineae bacterium]|nr:MAG: sugar ABC transporter substrate-binding protein [Anaerolineae bacterium]